MDDLLVGAVERTSHMKGHITERHHISFSEDFPQEAYEALSNFHRKLHECPYPALFWALMRARLED